MPHLCKHIIAAVLLAGGVLLAGTSFVDAHGKPKSCEEYDHFHTSTSKGLCAYMCSVLGHNDPHYWEEGKQCKCCDTGSGCPDD